MAIPLLVDRAVLGLNAATSDEDRYSGRPLSCVRVTASHAEATNGHYLLRVPMPKDDPADWPITAGPNGTGETPAETLIPAATAAAMLKTIPKPIRHGAMPILQHAALYKVGNCIEGYTTDAENVGTFRVPAIDGKFPDSASVIPDDEIVVQGDTRHRTVTLSATYLRDIANYVIKHADRRNPSIRLTVGTNSEGDPVRLEFYLEDADRTATGALMPMRGRP